ncbi:MAG: NAD(P)/FAD-dependent oxidoreductase [bacterium]|nr:NAD(P)/FAD-dependent oxidoreductase [bacterium]
MNKYDVIVVGAGPAGLMAAGQAAESGTKVLLLEKMDTPANKLRITGGGRCNITNAAPINEFIKSFGMNGRFLRPVFSRFFSTELLQFFYNAGIRFVTEADGKIFPEDDKADTIVDFLLNWIRERGVTLQTGFTVNRLLIENGKLTGIAGSSSDKIYYTENIIITTGGASYPGTGSSGDGYSLAKSAGHTIINIRPSLIPLEIAGNIAQDLQGISLSNVTVKVLVNGKNITSRSGEMVFTHYGVSGPLILLISKIVVEHLLIKQKVFLSIDLKPEMDDKTLDAFLLSEIKTHGKKLFKTLLNEWLQKKLVPACINLLNIQPDKLCNQINAEERKKLRIWLKDFRLEVKNYRPLPEAIVTAGGVNLKEIDPNTMGSKLIKGLYFAGEVLDLDADTGGYNLQAAFSTGWAAGKAAAATFLH